MRISNNFIYINTDRKCIFFPGYHDPMNRIYIHFRKGLPWAWFNQFHFKADKFRRWLHTPWFAMCIEFGRPRK